MTKLFQLMVAAVACLHFTDCRQVHWTHQTKQLLEQQQREHQNRHVVEHDQKDILFSDICSNITEEQMDLLAARMFTFGESGRDFPINQQELEVYCAETVDILDKFENYVHNCVRKRFTRTLLMIVSATIKKRTTTLCDTSSGSLSKRQQILLASASCANSVKAEHQKCINIGINYAIQSMSLDGFSSKIPFLCCNILSMDICMSDAMMDNRSGKCTKKQAQDAMDFYESIRSDAMKYMCGDYNPEENDTCDRYITPPSTERPTENYHFYLLPLIKSLTNL